MVKIGTGEKIYPLVKIALVVDALKEAGVRPEEALRGSHVSLSELYSVATRVSLNQVVEVYRNAVRLAPDPHFAYLTGLRFHVSTYSMYDAPSGNLLQRDRRQRRLDHRATATSSR